MKRREILVAEEDSSVASTIRSRLERGDEFAVQVVANGSAALRRISAEIPDAALIDTVIRDVTVAELCKVIRLRQRTARLPLILLGRRDEGPGLVEGLSLGADDYITKPIDLDELEARLRAVLRRHVHQPRDVAETFQGAHVRADFAGVHVVVDGAPVSLTRREFELLRFLVRRRNEVVGRDEILTNVWGADGWDERIVDSAMWKLRRKMGGAGRQIETVTGFGYRFNEPALETRRSS
jgi:DNA-binding response OmpR family regulator